MPCAARVSHLSLPILLAVLLGLAGAGARAWAAQGTDRPVVEVSKAQAGTGGSVTVTGSGWRPRTLLTLLVCGQAEPSRGVTGGTNSCANADGRAVTADAEGRFRRELPVVEPPVPCPCVVHVETVTGAEVEADTAFQVAGHAVEPLPADRAGGRLSLLEDTRLRGADGLLTWFGSPPTRTLVVTVGNVGTSPVKDPVFQVGASHGVFAPQWQDQRWRGTIRPGAKARIELPVELAGGAHGDYTVSLKYGGKVLAEHPWGVGRPWGVTLFWGLVLLVVPAALFRAGLAVVDHVRPRHPGHAARRPRRPRRPAAPRRPPASPGSSAPSAPWIPSDAGPPGPRRT
ncbi:hypothetical protein [Streptomyces djakartensis]|uniref:Neocarzinostatin family protein n=1 Tax=Streptomyces djakartensis TaxID=68193 RepID=A0ABQ2ZT30_9ACTN|nr:hypothetical protein [Streptomyces djakartensis]GGY23487.1 hypothetical protein GCM10010384_33280 [Streptomyces djakartensis]